MSRSSRLASRVSNFDQDHDDFPTPPWATRAIFNYVLPRLTLKGKTVIEPSCGRGYMTKTLQNMGAKVTAVDAFRYDGLPHRVDDYLTMKTKNFDLTVMNPPFKFGQKFVEKALTHTNEHVIVLIRTLWGYDTGDKRFMFIRDNPPNLSMTFAGRMDAAKGKVLKSNSSFMSHTVFMWDVQNRKPPGSRWEAGLIPPAAQKELERESDYLPSFIGLEKFDHDAT